MEKKAIKKLIFFLLLLTFLKGVVWSFFIPLWHFPDEQAHFAHVAYLAEGGKPPIGRQMDLSEEILTSERILRTKRDGWGNNSFTYRPDFNLDYSDNFTGLREEEIKNLPLSTRKNFLKKEAATYNDPFYQISVLIYKLFYSSDLFVRVFTVRIFWLFCIIGIVYLSFLITKEIFPQQLALQISIPILVSFQPMFTFVSSGITIDNLVNLFFTLIIYLSVVVLKRVQLINLVFLILVFLLGIATKNNFLIAASVVLFPFLYLIFEKRSSFFKIFPLFILLFFASYSFLPSVKNQVDLFILSRKIPFFDFKTLPNMKNYTLWRHFLWTVKHTIAEVIPWYWGVFRWLSLVLPRWTNRVLMRILGVAVIGLLIKLVTIFKKRQFNKQNFLLAFIFYTAFVYFLILFIWDWCFFKGNGYSFGIQGRYYFPVITTHMILLTVGLETFFLGVFKLIKFCKFLFLSVILSPPVGRTKDLGTKCRIIYACARFFAPHTAGLRMTKVGHFSLCLWFVILNCLAFYWVVGSYYDTSSFEKFIIQASQYKPWFAKGIWLASILVIYLFVLLIFLFKLTRFSFKSSDEK